jgi:ABC-2 type transport system permease protein
MLDHRDLGAGLVAPRRGRPTASRFLTGPVALNARLQRGSLLGWTFGISVTGVAYGSIANSIETFVQDNKAMSDLLVGSSGASLVDAYLATSTRVAALIGAGFAVQSMLRLRSEEAALRAEPVLATAVSRVRWATGHLGFAIAGSVIVLLATGLSTGISAALVTHDSGLVPRVVVAALAYSPAVWLLVCVALATIGLVPRAAPIVWALLVASFVVTFLGPLLSLPGWATNVSPFEHLALLPGAPANAVPYLALIAVAGGLALAGIHGLSRRDIG